MARALTAVVDGTLDLLLGSRCSACGTAGRALCPTCRARLPAAAGACWPTPTPPGLVRPTAAGEYAGALRSLVIDHKEHGRLALVRPLGHLLALAVLDACRAAALTRGVLVVPVPSHPAVVRVRGHDPVLRMARVAAAEVRRRGVPARVSPALRVVGRPRDQAGLGAEERAANVHGRFTARCGAAAGPAAAAVVLVDDVVTTGATLREAQRALEDSGLAPVGAAAVAATRRQKCPVGHVPDPGLT